MVWRWWQHGTDESAFTLSPPSSIGIDDLNTCSCCVGAQVLPYVFFRSSFLGAPPMAEVSSAGMLPYWPLLTWEGIEDNGPSDKTGTEDLGQPQLPG